MPRAAARSLTGTYSQRQLARDAHLSKHRVGTLIRLKAADPAALTWRDALALRALVDCGLTVDPSTRLSERDHRLLAAVRRVLAAEHAVDSETRIVVIGDRVETADTDRALRRHLDDAFDGAADQTVHLIPIGAWAQSLLTELTELADQSASSRSAA